MCSNVAADVANIAGELTNVMGTEIYLRSSESGETWRCLSADSLQPPRASLRGSAENLTPLFLYSSLALRNTVFPVSDYFSFIFDNAFQMKETIHLLIVFALLGPS